MSGFYLPGLFGRSDAVREDLAALAALLPAARERYPEAIWAEVVRFVLAEGELDAHQRTALRRLLPEERDGGRP